MDKFGIFNLLSNFMGQNSSPQTDTINNPDKKSDFLSSLFSNLTANNTPPPQKQSQPLRPLQSSMLSTINSHDKFIERVNRNNKKK